MIEAAAGVVTVDCILTRRHRLGWDGGPIRTRTLFGRLTVDDRLAGAVELAEYDIEVDTHDRDFFYVLDASSQEEADTATVLCSCWSQIADRVGAFGPILIFRLAWMHPEHAKGALWATAARQMVNTYLDRHALIIAKAFPLEYEGRGAPDLEGVIQARQRAMVRYYGRLLGLRRLPGWAGREGWLYAIPPRLEGCIPVPKRCRRPAWL